MQNVQQLNFIIIVISIFTFIVGIEMLVRKEKSIITNMLFADMKLYNLLHKIEPVLSARISTEKKEKISDKLIYAGHPYGLTYKSFIGLQALTVATSILVSFVLVGIGLPSIIMFILIPIGYFLPISLVNEKANKRQLSIKKNLPSMVSLLSTAVRSGVELNTAMDLIAKHIPDTLGAEMRFTLQEIATGKTRTDAFRALTKRTDVPMLSRFIETILVAEERGGVNISQILEDFVDDIRKMQRLDMQEKVKKLSTKMLAPIVICIFLPMIVMLLAPIGFTLMQNM